MLAEKLRRALENKYYQNKHKSVEGDHFQFEAKKEKTLETLTMLEIIFLCLAKRGSFQIFILAEHTENFWDINWHNFAFYVITIHNVK